MAPGTSEEEILREVDAEIASEEAEAEADEVFGTYAGATMCDLPKGHSYEGKTIEEIQALRGGSFEWPKDEETIVKKLKIAATVARARRIKWQADEDLDRLAELVYDSGSDERKYGRAVNWYWALRIKVLDREDLSKVLSALAHRAVSDDPSRFDWFNGVDENVVESEEELGRLLEKYNLYFTKKK